MADVQPFRAVRYSGAAGPLADLVAPPYDAVSPDEQELLLAKSPYNVLRLTLPDSTEAAGRLYREWLAAGVLERDRERRLWLLADDFAGPDDVCRTRLGLVCSLAAEPYERGSVLPHEHTEPDVRDERVRLLRATGAQPEPIFTLVESWLELEVPDREPDVAVAGSRAWRLEDGDSSALEDAVFLIADGHHRYEAAVQLGRELPGAARVMALVVPVSDPGLHAFATHRVFSGRPDLARAREGEACADLEAALARLAGEPHTHAAVVAYRSSGVRLVRGAIGELDAALVDRCGREGIAYTPSLAEAVDAVDAARADVAFVLRDPRIEDVFAVARRGERMPPKSTYFHPKPLSGLLFHPIVP